LIAAVLKNPFLKLPDQSIMWLAIAGKNSSTRDGVMIKKSGL